MILSFQTQVALRGSQRQTNEVEQMRIIAQLSLPPNYSRRLPTPGLATCALTGYNPSCTVTHNDYQRPINLLSHCSPFWSTD